MKDKPDKPDKFNKRKYCVNDPEFLGICAVAFFWFLFCKWMFLAGMVFTVIWALCFCWFWENVFEKKPEDYKDLKGG